jgi:hypothetical protein
VGDGLGSGVAVSVLTDVSVLGAVAVGPIVAACPQAEKANDRNTSTNKNFVINWILFKTGNRYHTALGPVGKECL